MVEEIVLIFLIPAPGADVPLPEEVEGAVHLGSTSALGHSFIIAHGDRHYLHGQKGESFCQLLKTSHKSGLFPKLDPPYNDLASKAVLF